MVRDHIPRDERDGTSGAEHRKAFLPSEGHIFPEIALHIANRWDKNDRSSPGREK